MNLNQAAPGLSIIDGGPSVGANLGAGTGAGLSQGLQMLLERKMQGMQQQKIAEGLAALGLPAEAALLDPSLQKVLLAQQGQQRQLSLLTSLLGGGGSAGSEELVESESVSPSGEIGDEAILAATQINPALGRTLQSQKEFRQREKLSAYKETKEFRKEIRDESKAAKENVARLERMQELVGEGKLTNPLLYSTLNKFGLDLPVLLSPDSQEFQKLTIDFLRDARQIFGARVTNFEAQQFLKSIPSLLQTKDGKKRVIRNLKTLARGAQVRADAAQKIIKESGGVPPLDIAEKTDERAEPELQRLYQRFAGGIGTEGTEAPDVVAVVLPDGRRGTVPRENLKEALKRGAKRR